MQAQEPKTKTPPTVGDLVSAHNRGMITITMLTAAVLFLGASFYPSPLVFPILSGFFTISAMVSMVIALAKRQNPIAPIFTFWDKAAVLLFLGIGAGLLTDMQAAQSYVEALQASATQKSGGG